MSLFLRMDAACAERLAQDERDSIDPIVYCHILEVCAAVAQCYEPVVAEPIPRPPATQYIKVNLVIPDDFVWRADLSFARVELVNNEGDELIVAYAGGRITTHDPSEHLRVAVSPYKAMAWNEERCCMGESTLRQVAEAYGVF